MMVAIATLLFIEDIRQTIERDECIDDAIWACVVCFPRRVVQVERSVGEKCPSWEKAAIPRDGVRNGLKSIADGLSERFWRPFGDLTGEPDKNLMIWSVRKLFCTS